VLGLKKSLALKPSWRWARVAVLLLVGWSLLAWVMARGLVVRSELAHSDALVVLAGSATYIERTRYAAQLFKKGSAPKIILTNDNLQGRWSEAEGRNLFFIELAAEELRREGVPAEKIELIPRIVSSTYEEAVLLREYASGQGLRSIMVVTSAYQSRRALWTLRRVFDGSGIAVGLDAPEPGEQSPRPATWWWRPLGWKMVAGEYLKLIYYRIRY
jgi:uncharacterized SAM-binding protein YcdF (DUF218 family)